MIYSYVRVSGEALLTRATVVPGGILAQGIFTAGTRYPTLVNVLAVLLAVARVTGLALAQKIRRQIATLGILNAAGRELRIFALVNV